MDTIENSEVAEVFRHYPQRMRQKLLLLRQLVLDTASETEGVGVVEETLKWGEPSYVSKGGSTVRMSWKEKNPHQYALAGQAYRRLFRRNRVDQHIIKMMQFVRAFGPHQTVGR